MKIQYALLALSFCALVSCHHRGGDGQEVAEPTPAQQKMLDNGWTVELVKVGLLAISDAAAVANMTENDFAKLINK